VTEPAEPRAYWHLTCDRGVVSRLTRRHLTDFTMTEVARGARPLDVQSLGATDTGSIDLAVIPAGIVGDWHETPRPLWGVVLAGRFFLEAMDGTRAELMAGELFLGEDQGTQPVDSRRGHRSGAVGPDTVLLLMIPVDPSSKGIS
jgi:hypothetical protein